MVKGLIIFWSILKEQYDKKNYYFLYKIIVLKKSSSPLPYHNQTKSPHTLPPATFPRRPDHILNFLKFYIFILYIRFWIREQSYCSSSSHIICWPQKKWDNRCWGSLVSMWPVEQLWTRGFIERVKMWVKLRMWVAVVWAPTILSKMKTLRAQFLPHFGKNYFVFLFFHLLWCYKSCSL